MSGTEGIVRALAHKSKAGKAARNSKLIEGFASARYKLMNVGLVSNVKNYMVVGGVEYPVYSHRKLGNTKIRSQMSSRLSNLIYKKLANFVAKRFKLTFRKLFKISG